LPGPPTGAPRSVASDIFIGGLLASAAVDLATLHSVTTAVRVIGISLSVAVIAAAVWVLIQCSRGTLLPWLRKLVIATVAVMGLEYYAGTLVASLGVSGQTLPLASNATLMSPGFVVLRELSSGAAVMLGIAGVVLVLRGRAEQPDIIYKEPETPAPSKLPGTPEE
jgi:predicted neutral ceramidase superfamily lipid hydrolase